MDLSRELREALAAASAAGRYALAEYAGFTPIPDAPASISTHVDLGCQEIILKQLRAAFPADGLVAEEKTPTVAAAPAGAARVWVVDPIDGTRGFAMKNGEFSVMIGLLVEGVPVLGVVLEPVPKRLTYSSAGAGCWTQTGDGERVRCRVSDQPDPSAGVLAQSRTKPGARPKAGVTATLPGRTVETYSAGIKLGLVARGEADYYISDHANFFDWDVCAGHALVLEAGGAVSQADGAAVPYGLPGPRLGLLASNGRMHAELVRRLGVDEG